MLLFRSIERDGRDAEEVEGRDKYVLSHVMDTDQHVFHPHHPQPEPEVAQQNDFIDHNCPSDDYFSNNG